MSISSTPNADEFPSSVEDADEARLDEEEKKADEANAIVDDTRLEELRAMFAFGRSAVTVTDMVNAIKAGAAFGLADEVNQIIRRREERVTRAEDRRKRAEARDKRASARREQQESDFILSVLIANKSYDSSMSPSDIIRGDKANLVDRANSSGNILPPVFQLPKIKQGLFSFRDLENSVSARGRLSLDTGFNVDRALRDASISARRPEIILKMPLFQMIDNRGTIELHELRQFEKRLKLESLDSSWASINAAAKKEFLDEISDFHAASSENDEKYLQFLSDLRNIMNISIDFIDVKKNSKQLTNAAKSFAQQLLEVKERDFGNFPEDVESFISEVCGFTKRSPDCFSNTKILHTIIREFANSIHRHHPTLLSSAIDKRNDQKSLTYARYEPEGFDTHSMSVKELGNRNVRRVIAQDGSNTEYRLSVTESFYNVLPGIAKLERGQDRIRVISTLLHNELTVSAGIGKLLGTNLGNTVGVSGVDPVEKILGGFFKNSSSVLAGTGAALSYADMLVINENTRDGDVVVLPFERSIIQGTNGREYLPGSVYFVEGSIKQGNSTTPLASFSKKLSDLDGNAQDAFKVLLNLGEECKISPDNIVIRCLKSIRNIASVLLVNSPVNPVPVSISLPTAFLTFSKNKNYRDRDYRISETFKFRQTPVDTLFTVCALRRSETDEANARNNDQKTFDFIPSKSYARLISPAAVSIYEEGYKSPEESNQLNNYKNAFDKLLLDNIDWDQPEVAGAKSNFSRPEGARRQSENLEYYEASFFAENRTIFDEIVEVLRSVQEDAFAINQSASSNFSYLDSDGLTRYNRWDDNTMLACIFEIMRCLVFDLLPFRVNVTSGVANQSNITSRYNVSWDDDVMLLLRNFLDVLISTYESGAPLEDIFDAEGASNAAPGVSSSTTFRPAGLRAGQVIDLVNSLIEQRKFYKVCLGYLNALAKNVNESNKKLSEFFQSSAGIGNFSDQFNKIKSSKSGNLAIEMLTESQNSLKRCYSLSRAPMQRESRLKINTSNSREEDDIQEFFLDTMSKHTSLDDIALCVGIPSGLIEGLQNPKIIEESSNDTALPRISGAKNINIMLEIHKVSELFPDIQYAPASLIYDPQLWIMPGSLAFRRDELTGDVIKTVKSIVEGTTFTRIVNGRVVDARVGSEILIDAESKDETLDTLKNHVIDSIYKNFARDVVGVTLDETSWFTDNKLGSNIVDTETFISLQKMLLNPVVANTAMISSDQLSLMFEQVDEKNLPGMRQLRPPQILLKLISDNRLSKPGVEKVLKLLGNGTLNSFVESQRLLCPRLFDRVFTVLLKSSGSSDKKIGFGTPIVVSSVESTDATSQRLIPLKRSFEVSGYMCSVSLR